jgi:hypothetical protein
MTGAETRVAPELELGAFRLIQEALRNIVRHAETNLCTVAVEFHPDELRLHVGDAGLGFDCGSQDEPSLTRLSRSAPTSGSSTMETWSLRRASPQESTWRCILCPASPVSTEPERYAEGSSTTQHR